MYRVTDINETIRILGELGYKTVYKDIRTDEDGVNISVPCFLIGSPEPISEEADR